MKSRAWCLLFKVVGRTRRLLRTYIIPAFVSLVFFGRRRKKVRAARYRLAAVGLQRQQQHRVDPIFTSNSRERDGDEI